jgi:Fe-S oxidoreductase
MEKVFFVPGCAYVLYNRPAIDSALAYLKTVYPGIVYREECCYKEQVFPEASRVITTCSGCHKRYRTKYPQYNLTVESLWEVIALDKQFPYPDHCATEVCIFDACPSRGQPQIHTAVRTIARALKLCIKEYDKNRENTICCGVSQYGKIPLKAVKKMMAAAVAPIPGNIVLTYCPFCLMAMRASGKKALFLLELLFDSSYTVRAPFTVQDMDIVDWNEELFAYRGFRNEPITPT